MRYCGGGFAVAAAGFLALTAGSASAATFDYNGYSVVDEINVTISGSPGQNGYFGSGQIDLDGTGPNKGEVLATWCLDVFDDLQGSGTYTVVTSGFTDDGGRPGSPAIASATMEDIGSLIQWGDSHLNANIPHFGTGLVSAAVQLAIWTIEYSGTGATFTSDNSSVNKMVKWLVHQAEENGNGKLGAFTGSLGEVIDPFNNQGLVFDDGGINNNIAFTPLPSTWTMLLIGFLGFGFLAYRGRQTRSAATAAA
jgi:hypothetical protein